MLRRPDHLIEWEWLQEPISVKRLAAECNLPEGISDVTVSRDESYRLRVEAHGTTTGPIFGPIADVKSGSPAVTCAVHGELGPYDVRLDDMLFAGSRTIDGTGTYTAHVHANIVTLHARSHEAPAWVADWYLNGVSNAMYFTGSTERRVSEHHHRARVKAPDVYDSEWKRDFDTSWSGSRDYLLVPETDQTPQFLITHVPKAYGPSWSKNLCIEFQTQWGVIPTVERRVAIGELVSFVIGRHLLLVGSTTFSELGELLEGTARSPWGDAVRAKCSDADLPPMWVQPASVEWGQLSHSLATLLPPYLEQRDSLRLSDALWRYWIAREAPLGISLPIYASALETLKVAWFKSSQSASKAVYMPKHEFERLTEDAFRLIQDQLAGHKYSTRIMNRLRAMFNMGANEGLEQFLDEIGLPFGTGERTILQARNAMAHGGRTDADWHRVALLTRGYDSLLHRVILRLLGHLGPYVDRSVLGWPSRDLLDPLGIE